MSVILALALGVAADPPPAAGQAPVQAQANERICRGGGQRTLGSHIRTRRRCQTAEQWQREDEARAAPAPGLLVTQGQNDGRTGIAPR